MRQSVPGSNCKLRLRLLLCLLLPLRWVVPNLFVLRGDLAKQLSSGYTVLPSFNGKDQAMDEKQLLYWSLTTNNHTTQEETLGSFVLEAPRFEGYPLNLSLLLQVSRIRGTRTSFLNRLHLHFDPPVSSTATSSLDATFIRRNSKQFAFSIPPTEYGSICAAPGMGPEGPNGYNVLSNIRVTAVTEENDTSLLASYKRQPTLFCAVYTYQGGASQVDAILETWGKRCDGFIAASTFTNQSVATVDLPHLGKAGSYHSLWQKVRSMFAYIYEHYVDDYDFFHLSGDDTYLIVENLKAYLSTLRSPHGVHYSGCWTHPFWKPHLPADFIYNGGGPGYTLSRAAVKLFVEKALLTCYANDIVSYEDMLLGACMRYILNVTIEDSRDEKMQNRLHAVDPELASQFGTIVEKGGYSRQDALVAHFLFRQYSAQGGNTKTKFSPESASFHLIKSPDKMRRLEKILYRRGEADCTCDGTDDLPPASGESLQGHTDCKWNFGQGFLWNADNCTSWKKQLQRVPPSC